TSPNNNPPSNERPRRVEGQGGDRATRDRWNADRDELTAERLHSLLERRLERMSAQEERMRRVIELLDEGASIDDLRDEYRDLLFDRDTRPGGADDEGKDAPLNAGGDDAGIDPRGARERGRDRVTDEDRAKFLAFLAEEFPEIHERVMEVAPDAADGGPVDIDPRFERRIMPLVEMMRLKERDPEMFTLRKDLWNADRQAWDLARKVRDASEADRAAAAEELHAVLGTQFDLQLRVHQLELDRLESRLAGARREAAEQATHRDDLINERLMDILSRTDGPPDSDRRGPRRERDDRRPAP
ncbi:MAG: hypothetical protein KDA30_05045, partial [Phycisphaerales bacterium]|nr:hypothetical protein [Phycisphaerales bacterium]